MKFKKKPVVIDAVQWSPDILHIAVQKCYKADTGQIICVNKADNGKILSAKVLGYDTEVYAILTLEGWHEVTPGDWIIQGVKGEFYPCKPDIFELTYEAV
jgi:hypothetical protein